MSGSLATELFHEEPAGTFSDGCLLRSAPDLAGARHDPNAGYWHCDIADEDKLTWTDRVYELFGLPAGAPIERDWAVERYSARSRATLERVRSFGVKRRFGFILDAEIRSDESASRWIRVLAVPIVADGRVVGLHGLKRAL